MCFLLFGGTILFIFLPFSWFGSSDPKKKKWFGSSCEHIARLLSDSLIMDMNGLKDIILDKLLLLFISLVKFVSIFIKVLLHSGWGWELKMEI